MPVLELDDAEIYYEEFGEGYPILLFAPGGMRSRLEMWHAPEDGPARVWNDWTEILSATYRVIAMDQRNAGRSKGAMEADHGWHTYTGDQLALMDHLNIAKFHTLGGCIGTSFCFSMGRIAPSRISAAVLQNPIGVHPEHPTYFPDSFADWARDQGADRPALDEAAVMAFGQNLWGGDFVFCVDRGFVGRWRTPALVLPGNDRPHPAVIGQEVAELLPNAECLPDWKGPDHLDAQRDKVLEFLARHTT